MGVGVTRGNRPWEGQGKNPDGNGTAAPEHSLAGANRCQTMKEGNS
jgi:hypothetical protein